MESLSFNYIFFNQTSCMWKICFLLWCRVSAKNEVKDLEKLLGSLFSIGHFVQTLKSREFLKGVFSFRESNEVPCLLRVYSEFSCSRLNGFISSLILSDLLWIDQKLKFQRSENILKLPLSYSCVSGAADEIKRCFRVESNSINISLMILQHL